MDAYLQRVIDEMESATEGLADQKLHTLRDAPGKWSAAQKLEHLILAFTGTTRNILNAAKRNERLRGGTLKERIGTWVVVRLGFMPEGRQAPQNTRPPDVPGVDVRERFRKAVREMDAALAAREHDCRADHKIAIHPILGPLSAREWRKFHLVHTRHHMAQIRAMRAGEVRKDASAA